MHSRNEGHRVAEIRDANLAARAVLRNERKTGAVAVESEPEGLPARTFTDASKTSIPDNARRVINLTRAACRFPGWTFPMESHDAS